MHNTDLVIQMLLQMVLLHIIKLKQLIALEKVRLVTMQSILQLKMMKLFLQHIHMVTVR